MIGAGRRRALEIYARTIADLLRLQAWDIEVLDTAPEDEEAVLAVDPDPRRWYVPIKVKDTTFFTETPEEQRQDVTHEIVHVILAEMWIFVYAGSWRHQLSFREHTMVEEGFRHELEKATDFLARVISPTMPLPPEWPDA